MSFHIGQKVVCVDDTPYSISDRISLWWYEVIDCEIGFIGTICNIYFSDGDEIIELIELPSPEAGPWRAGFLAKCFRPLVERKTDISIFTSMLNNQKQNA